MTSPSTSAESLTDTDESESTATQKMDLLEYDDDIFTRYKSRVIEKAWATWTEDQNTILKKYINYHLSCTEYGSRCWAKRPTNKPEPKNLNINIEEIMKT